MKKFKAFCHRLIKEESAQGATEYILLVVVIVALVGIFRNNIKDAVQGKIEELSKAIGGFSG